MRHAALALTVLALVACGANRRPSTGSDTGPHTTDSGPVTQLDAGPGHDAAVIPMDAFSPGVDAFVPPMVDAGHDAAITLVDAGHDAFVPPAVDAGNDAFVGNDAWSSGGCTPLPSSTTTINGTISAGATYNRPQTMCGGLSAVGTAVYYDTRVFCNTGSARSYSFALDAAATNGIGDPFVIVYTGTGDISTLTCLTSDDDGGAAPNSLATATVPAGATITIVATDFDNDVTGDYVLTITPM